MEEELKEAKGQRG